MKHLKIKNLGPITQANIELKRINVIIGPQSSGKSCILKTACYCTWVEKRIELAQSSKYFELNDNFIKEFVRFHKLDCYVKKDTYIEYESNFMFFSYEKNTSKFSFRWKEDRWKYRRQKVTYIPAERNMVAAIPNWFDVKLPDDNIRNFISDWEVARKSINLHEIDVLNLGIKYHYEPTSNKDKVIVEDGLEIDFTNTSSGLQSLIPLFIHLYYLDKLQYKYKENESVAKVTENERLRQTIHNELFKNNSKQQPFILNTSIDAMPNNNEDIMNNEKLDTICKHYMNINHCDIFLEEPEANLFPPTQSKLVDWLIGMTNGDHPSNIFIATHSPYVLTSFLEKDDIDIGLLFILPDDKGKNLVKVASKDDMQQIYDYGIDAFFNIESL